MAEMKQEPLETQVNGLIVAEDMELAKHQVVIKNKINDEEDQEDEVKMDIEPQQRIETLYEIEVEIPPDSTPVYCSNCGQNFTKESQLQHHKCFVSHENVSSNVQSTKTPTPSIQSMKTLCSKDRSKKTPLSKDQLKRTPLSKDQSKKTLLSKNSPPVTVQKYFCCPVCQKSFKWESQLQMHMVVHSGESIDICKICRKTFKNKSDYQIHLRQHQEYNSPQSKVRKENHFCCSVCNRGFVSEECLVMHKKQVHYMCPVCPRQCHNLRSVGYHMRMHYTADGTLDPERGYAPSICSICKESFAFQNLLIEHRETSHNIGPFICSQCGKHLVSMDSLFRHEVHHYEGNRYKCSDCNDGFPTRQKLIIHMKTHKKSFVCSVCEKTYKHERRLTQHMEGHVEKRPFKCSLCEKSFMSQRELLRHQKNSHYICPICSEQFLVRGKVNEHMMTHPRAEVEAYQRPFKCSECGARFPAAGSLLQHQMGVHSKERPVECPVCEKSFKTKIYLQLHQKREHTTTPFQCPLCKKHCKSKAGLAAHMNYHKQLATNNQDESTPSSSENCE